MACWRSGKSAQQLLSPSVINPHHPLSGRVLGVGCRVSGVGARSHLLLQPSHQLPQLPYTSSSPNYQQSRPADTTLQQLSRVSPSRGDQSPAVPPGPGPGSPGLRPGRRPQHGVLQPLGLATDPLLGAPSPITMWTVTALPAPRAACTACR